MKHPSSMVRAMLRIFPRQLSRLTARFGKNRAWQHSAVASATESYVKGTVSFISLIGFVDRKLGAVPGFRKLGRCSGNGAENGAGYI